MKLFLKEVIKKIFDILGVGIYRKKIGLRITLDEVLAHVLKLGFKPQTIIDVGVAYGTFELYEKFPEAYLLLIEPLEEFEEVLKKICRKHKKAEYVLAAAGVKSGKITINVRPGLTDSSVFKEVEGSYVNDIPREVPLVTIDELCVERNLKGPYLTKVDVQGAELIVLDGAKKVLQDTELVILEVQLFQFLINCPQLYDVVSYMKERGFVVYDIFSNNYRPIDGALASVDIVFVKEKGYFRKHHFYATQQQGKKLVKRLRSFNIKEF